MRLSTGLPIPARGEATFSSVADSIRDLERAGLDVVWVAESYGFDAPTLMGYVAARCERLQIGSGILQIYTRTPTLLAQTAAGLDRVSNGRAILGLGVSGPQVIEGLHGVPYDRPYRRTREVIEICRRVWQRDRVEYQGQCYTLPLPPGQGTGQGIALKLNGFSITGQADAVTGCAGGQVANESGILVNGMRGAVIQGPGIVQRFRMEGIQISGGSSRVLVTQVTASTNCRSGIFVNASSDNDIEANTSVRNGNGTSPCGGI